MRISLEATESGAGALPGHASAALKQHEVGRWMKTVAQARLQSAQHRDRHLLRGRRGPSCVRMRPFSGASGHSNAHLSLWSVVKRLSLGKERHWSGPRLCTKSHLNTDSRAIALREPAYYCCRLQPSVCCSCRSHFIVLLIGAHFISSVCAFDRCFLLSSSVLSSRPLSWLFILSLQSLVNNTLVCIYKHPKDPPF